MGATSSSYRRRNNNYYHSQNPYPPSQLLSSSSSSSYPYPSDPYPAPAPYPYSAGAGPPPPPPVPVPIYGNPLTVRPNFSPNYNLGWGGFQPPPRPMLVAPPPPPPPVYVEHQQAKKVKNDVNVHKDTIRLEIDDENPDHYLVSFVFDASFDGSITIFYFAKEEPDCKFIPEYAEVFVPVKVPFQKGPGQKFRQPSGTGIDLGFFELDDLSKPSSGEDVFPLVISAEVFPHLISLDEHHSDSAPNPKPHMQITQAVIEKNNGDPFKVKVIRQILWIDGERYELREIYGIGNSAGSLDDSSSETECIICLTEPKDTAVLPCRHMCLCSECAKALRLQSNKCPICRQPIEEIMEIKISTIDK